MTSVDSRRYRAGMTRVAAAAFVLLAAAGCGPKESAPEENTPTARPGAYCRQAGQQAVTDGGKPVVCSTTSGDDKLRWRADR